MDAEHLNCYRINYDAKFWTSRAEHLQETLCAPIGAVLAVNALCNEVERLTKQRDELVGLCRQLREAEETKNQKDWTAVLRALAKLGADKTGEVNG